MSKLKQQFIDLRKTTPKHIQWLLLAAAFIVVLILITLLFSNNKKQQELNISQTVAEVKAIPDSVSWTNVTVGDKKTETIKISATVPVKILDVKWEKINGFNITNTCEMSQTADTGVGCEINATYEPTEANGQTKTTVSIDWYEATKSDQLAQTTTVDFTLSAESPIKITEPVEEPAPVALPVYDQEPTPIIEPEPVQETAQDQMQQDLNIIAPPIEIPDETSNVSAPEACSDFAFPGYDDYGRQIGWIKPEAGTYKFHPFSDKNCNRPTGVYNPNTGIITDINNQGKRIGSDAEHIGLNTYERVELPKLSNAPAVRKVNRAEQLSTNNLKAAKAFKRLELKKAKKDTSSYLDVADGNIVVSSQSYAQDRSFMLRQYKPIPATIVSDIRADIDALEKGVPVRATVDRNVYSDNGRNVIIPTGTLLLGYVTGQIPGPYKSIGRMNINWYQFILPNGTEFNFESDLDPYSGDSQGRIGVPGRGSTDYLEQFFMPMLTAFVPATINLINPIADAFVNQIDLDNNTVVQSGTMRSSELAKNEIITAWNQVAQKLMVDMMDNTVPPFTIAAGTRITVYSPVDLMVTCGDPKDDNDPNRFKKCAVATYGKNKHRKITPDDMGLEKAKDSSWVGQARSFQMEGLCAKDSDGLYRAPNECFNLESQKTTSDTGYSCLTLKLYCESLNYQSKKELQYKEYRNDQQKKYDQQVSDMGGTSSKQFKEEIIGVTYDEDGYAENPYDKQEQPVENVITCFDGSIPDANGCCAGEIYTDMGEMGFNCCPEGGGDCFPPIVVN